ncbi:MAG: hypothetical protein LBR53_03320 [Deltaproteobacteria bacterium]|nr:hypothetical protein [Deltaproteobacteria bacterium]
MTENFRGSLSAVKRILLFLLLTAPAALAALGAAGAVPASVPGSREHIVYFEGTAQELEVYKIRGRLDGPTMMILGGVQGDEPGGFLSADLYVDTALKRGNLIIVPRANFKSIINFDRGSDGDMNRKFGDNVVLGDPDLGRVRIIKNLMAESDVFLNLHDGSGFFRNHWESDQANPSRYGQCLIADAETYVNSRGEELKLGQTARKAVEIVNRDIPDEAYKFRFANHDTLSPQSRHKDQRHSATFYALTQLGIPAYGIETSKQLPSLEMKIHQHNLAVNAFMELYGLELEQPRINLDPPELHFLVLSVNGGTRIAVEAGQKVFLSEGDTLEVLYVGANYTRGISVDVLNFGTLNDLKVPLKITRPTSILARKDNLLCGKIEVDFFPAGEARGHPLASAPALRPPAGGGAGFLPEAGSLPGVPPSLSSAGDSASAAGASDAPTASAAGASDAPSVPSPGTPRVTGTIGPPPPAPPGEAPQKKGRGFLLEIDGVPYELPAGETLKLNSEAKVRLVDFLNGEDLPQGTVLNLRGFVGRRGDATGNDKGTLLDGAKDLIPRFAVRREGRVLYRLGAENGPELLYAGYLDFQAPVLRSVTFELNGVEKTLPLAGRWKLAPGTRVRLKKVDLEGDLPLESPRFTLGGRPVSADLPQTLVMPDIAVSLAVFSGGILTGKVVLHP